MSTNHSNGSLLDTAYDESDDSCCWLRESYKAPIAQHLPRAHGQLGISSDHLKGKSDKNMEFLPETSQNGEPLLKRKKTGSNCSVQNGANTRGVISEENRNDGSHFHMIPDELVLKILKMTVSSENRIIGRTLRAYLNATNRTYIIDVLGNVSSRFRRIARDRAFWGGRITLDFLSRCEEDVMINEKRLKRIADSFLGESARDITVRGDVPLMQINQQSWGCSVSRDSLRARSICRMNISKENIQGLSSKCPNLMYLSFYSIKLTEWPAEQNPWHSLKELALSFTESPNTFRHLDLHHIAPNLRTLKITEDGCPPIRLPDMTQCHELANVELIGGGHQSFCFPFNYKELAPFPCGLKKLTIIRIEFVEGVGRVVERLDTMEVLKVIKKHSTQCQVQYEFFQDMTTICSSTLY